MYCKHAINTYYCTYCSLFTIYLLVLNLTTAPSSRLLPKIDIKDQHQRSNIKDPTSKIEDGRWMILLYHIGVLGLLYCSRLALFERVWSADVAPTTQSLAVPAPHSLPVAAVRRIHIVSKHQHQHQHEKNRKTARDEKCSILLNFLTWCKSSLRSAQL